MGKLKFFFSADYPLKRFFLFNRAKTASHNMSVEMKYNALC